MLKFSPVRQPRPPNSLTQRILWTTFLIFAFSHTASAYVDKTVRWTKSPLRDEQGQMLPPAVSYEVWLLSEGGTEYLAATVNETTYTLRAQAGVTYYLRVRGISAQGQKSVFSPSSDPFLLLEATISPLAPQAGFGPAYPNPFNARTSIAYMVPEGLSSNANVSLEIFDVRGRRLRIFRPDRNSGPHEAHWDGRDDRGINVPAGMYLARFICGAYHSSTKLTLLP